VFFWGCVGVEEGGHGGIWLLLVGLIFQVTCASLLPWSLVAAGIINFVRALLLLVCTACSSELLGRINIILNITSYPI
jgi:hypothetical protein